MNILNKTDCEKFLDLAVKRTAKYLKDNNLNGITTGISGGIDSAVTAIIGLKALELLKKLGYKATYTYLFLDCDSDPYDLKKAEALAAKFKFDVEYVDLNDWYKSSPLLKRIPPGHSREKIAQGNIKARLRMITLYHTAQIHGYIYLDTDDISEEWMGFWTKHGDEGDLKILQHVTKTELYDIGEYLGIPKIILDSKPGDGLKVTPGSLAQHQLGLDYVYIEYIMSRFIGKGFDYDGPMKQLNSKKYQKLMTDVAKEMKRSREEVTNILMQSLKTAYKRKYGDNVCHLLPRRSEFGFLEVGTEKFNKKYLEAIRSL
ncbi:NAD(+) synthase [Candidatus Gottesmanbacteria bacterium]|nr:NAD(+) synthase [Candidatus Gottesmanbacteria bacterium]